MYELKPCPFCGSEDVLVCWTFSGHWVCMCRKCGTNTDSYDDNDDAVDAWNNRAGDAEPVRRGEWVLDGSAPEIDIEWYHCSCCGAFKVSERTPYCPQCGAKMELEGEK